MESQVSDNDQIIQMTVEEIKKQGINSINWSNQKFNNQAYESQKGRRKRCERVLKKEVSSGGTQYNNTDQNEQQEFTNVNTMDQFANLLLKEQQNTYQCNSSEEKEQYYYDDEYDQEEEEVIRQVNNYVGRSQNSSQQQESQSDNMFIKDDQQDQIDDQEDYQDDQLDDQQDYLQNSEDLNQYTMTSKIQQINDSPIQYRKQNFQEDQISNEQQDHFTNINKSENQSDKNKFKDTIYSQQTDIRSAISEINGNIQQKEQIGDVEKNNIILQYEFVLQQLNTQVQKLLNRNQELEQITVSNEMINQQNKQMIQDLQSQINQDKTQNEQKQDQAKQTKEYYEQELEKHKQILQFYSNELEQCKQENFDLEQKINFQQQQMMIMQQQDIENKQRLEDFYQKLVKQDQIIKKKDEEVFKLRQDNSQMFNDLKGFANNEENYKYELFEFKGKKQELEQLIQDLQEKNINMEMKIKSQNMEIEKFKRELGLQFDQINLNEKTFEQVKVENQCLRDKLNKLEQEKSNLINEKERGQRDCKNMQIELNRINALIHNYKNIAGGSSGGIGDFSFNPMLLMQQQQMEQVNMQRSSDQEKGVLKNTDQNQNYQQEKWNNQKLMNQYSDYSPIKKSDPNVSYAQRQKMIQNDQSSKKDKNKMVSQTGNLQNTLSGLIQEKQRLESEYSKIPITINSKSMQLKKRKEELEFELDIIDKNIAHVQQKLKDTCK